MKTKSHCAGHLIGMIGRMIISQLLLFLFVKTVHAQENKSASVVSSPPRVEIPGSQLQKITSAIVGQEYDLYIHLPRNYGNKDQKHPVLFLLDAQWDFPLVTAIFGQQFYDGFLPGLVIVGITWGGKNPKYDSLRARDLTPNNAAPVRQSGGAPKFLAFIKQELIPFIESKYLVSHDRTLMGSSFGGLFTLYALFAETESFQRYVLTSPAVGWANEGIYTLEKNYAAKQSRLPVRLFMAVGDLEDVVGFQKFADQLKARNHDGLALQTRVLENTGHSGTKAEGYTRGLQFVFARSSLKLDAAILAQYAGTYALNPETKVVISVEHDHLVAQDPYNAKLVLHAETEQDFYVPGQYLFARFKKDEQGRVTGFQLEQFGGEGFARRVGASD